jgi:hypothetical protein
MAKNTDSSTVLRDIDIPFFRLVMIILKFMIASIPAMIVFYALLFLIALGFAAAFGGGASLFNFFHLPHPK